MKNRNWQISQGSIIANTGEALKDIHPIIIEGQGHTSLSNVEAFSGGNGALTCVKEEMSWDYLLVRGDKKLTVSVWGARMRNYASDSPITLENDKAIIQFAGCFDKDEMKLKYVEHHLNKLLIVKYLGVQKFSWEDAVFSDEELYLIKRHYILERLAEKKEPAVEVEIPTNQLTLELC